MGDVNWDNVQAPQADDEDDKSGGGWLGTVIFVVLLVVGLTAGGAYLNSVMLGERVRDIVLEQDCSEPACVVDVRAAHPDCFSSSVTYAMPTSMADFQTPAGSPKLGIGTVNVDAYRACVLPETPKTLADEES